MGRFPKITARLSMAGAVALVAGSMMIVGVAVQSLTPAFADTSPFELYCSNTPIGNLAFNDVVITGDLSPATPSPGQQFSLENFQASVPIPATVAQDAAAVGNTSLSGSATAAITATGATPASMPTGALAYDEPLPNPVPPSGLTLAVPSSPATIGPFTATSSSIALSLTSLFTLNFNDAAFPTPLPPFNCSPYPNDVLPSGLAQAIPPGTPISPVVATAGQGTPPPPPTGITGPYELYCPHTPVGDLDFNDVTTSATISPGTLSAGDQFQVSGYQTDIPVPAGAVTAAAGLGNGSFVGLATSAIDAYGTTSPQVAAGSMGFDVPIPNPVPSSGVALDIPSSPTTVGPFTALGGPITIAQDQSLLVVAKLSDKAFKMSCTAYPNDAIASSGTTGTPPAATPIRPIIATGSASGTPITTTTTTSQPGGPGSGNQTPGAPYELYCPSTPVGNIALNDVVTTGSITPASLNEGDQFQVSGLQTQFTIPQTVAQQAENLGLTSLSGDLSLFLDVTGTQNGYNPGTVVGVTAGSSSSTLTTVSSGPIRGPFPGQDDLSFAVTLPSPVPSTGVQFTATSAPGSGVETFVAAGGPIDVYATGVNLNVSAFGDQFGLFCDTFANDSVPTGLSIQQPFNGYVEPLVATGSATIIPPPPTPPGAQGAYELYCPGTPVGNIALNNVNTSGTITPADPTPGEQFNLTGYQTTITLPSSIASAAAALGNSAITGTAVATVDASGATPAQIATGTMSFDVPLPSPIPPSGITLTLPSPAQTIGPFTASASGITIAQDASVRLDLMVSGSDLTLRCSAFPNNTEPTGIVSTAPRGSPRSPVIAVAGGGSTVPSGPTLTVSPATALTGGQSVSVTGGGYAENSEGNVLECNNAPGQPTVELGSPVNASLAIGCTAPSYNVVSTSASGTVSTTYDVIEGTVGPPCGASNDAISTCPNADSTGQNPATDAANYPCPPTAAQQAAGVTCTLMYGDLSGDSATAAIAFEGQTPPPPTVPTSTTTTTTTTTTVGASTPSGEITQAYQTLFDFADPSIADKVAVVQNGASIETALSQALSSSLASSATGANVDSISFPDTAGCTQVNLPSPCAQVTFDILGPGGTAILPNNQGYAVSVNGSWLVATNTVCALLGLFYEAEGMTGSPPGCVAPTSVSSSPTTVLGTGQGPSTSTTSSSSTDVSASTDPTPPSGPTTQAQSTSSPPSTSAAATKATSSKNDPGGSGSASTAAPVVQASSNSLAFTGVGLAAQWVVVAGSALIVLGFAMLMLGDVPRRLRWAVARRAGSGAPHGATDGARPSEGLWVGDTIDRDGPTNRR